MSGACVFGAVTALTAFCTASFEGSVNCIILLANITSKILSIIVLSIGCTDAVGGALFGTFLVKLVELVETIFCNLDVVNVDNSELRIESIIGAS